MPYFLERIDPQQVSTTLEGLLTGTRVASRSGTIPSASLSGSTRSEELLTEEVVQVWAQAMKPRTPSSTDIDVVKSKTSLRRCVEAVMPN